MAFTEDEKLVLNYFFTSLDSPVFVAKNFHPEVWALMQARYSRAKEGMRESFLQLLKEDPANYEALVEVLKDQQRSMKMDGAIDKAIKFMDKWVLGYGHASVAEGAVVGVALEGVSILSSKVIEDNRLAAYIEKSTRYVEFDRSSFYIDPVLDSSEFGGEVRAFINDLFDFYVAAKQPVADVIMKVSPMQPGQNEAAYRRAAAARAFDSIRYSLPACTKTNIGWTLNARSLAHAINKLLSSDLTELQEIGKLLQAEGQKALPSLLKYTGKNEYLSKTPGLLKEHSTALLPEPLDSSKPVELTAWSSEPEELITASILYRFTHVPFTKALQKARAMSYRQREELLDKYVGNMGEFDWPMRELEHAYFTFDISSDYGAFRDLQRHRIQTQTNQSLTTFHGYDTPPDIIAAGLQEKYDAIMQKADSLFRKLYLKYPEQAQYIVPLAYKKRYLVTANLRALAHMIKLRSKPAGHYSYRTTVRLMHDELKQHFPLCAKYIECSMSDDELGRLKAELKFQQKLEAGKI